MSRRRSVALLLVLAVLVAGCATMGITVKPWGDMTPKEKASQFVQTYNRQYEDTIFMATNPNITEAQKSVVRVKKAVLVKVWPMIKLYNATVVGGGVPSAADEQAILQLINQLASTLGG